MIYEYDAAVFSLPDFVGPRLEHLPISIIPPAIDPFITKNKPMSKDDAMAVVARFGLDPDRPFISQVLRFDPWKDPLGVIDCFKILKRNHLDLQLAMLGNFADDDPEGQVMYERVLEAAGGVPDLHIIAGLTDMVGPFQAQSRVILQKSLREGFGLTATEALWKGTPVVAGNVGGLRSRYPTTSAVSWWTAWSGLVYEVVWVTLSLKPNTGQEARTGDIRGRHRFKTVGESGTLYPARAGMTAL